jgi:FkbM family methyltransferase
MESTPLRIFLDVGAHVGQTAAVATDAKWSFDKVICFEPASSARAEFSPEALRRDNMELLPFGLWDRDAETKLFRAGYVGGSIFEDMGYLEDDHRPAETIRLLKASTWFRENIPIDATVFLKLNCEGSEVDILDDLIDSGELKKVYCAMIDYDARSSKQLRGRESKSRAKLRAQGYKSVVFSEDVMVGESHELRITHWLTLTGANEPALNRASLEQKYGQLLSDLSRRRGWKRRTRVRARDSLRILPSPMVSAVLRLRHIMD